MVRSGMNAELCSLLEIMLSFLKSLISIFSMIFFSGLLLYMLQHVYLTARRCRQPTRQTVIHGDKLFSTWWPYLLKLTPVRSKSVCNDMEGPGGSSDLVTLKFLSSRTVDPPRDTLKEQKHPFSLAHHLTLSLTLHLSVSLVPSPPSLLSWCFGPSKQVEAPLVRSV